MLCGSSNWTCARQDEPWDTTLWEEFCVSLGASSEDGLGLDEFIRFQTAMDSPAPAPASQPSVHDQAESEAEEALEPQPQPQLQPEPEPEPEKEKEKNEPAEAYAVWYAFATGTFMPQEQVRSWALTLTSSVAEGQWDDGLWPKLCASYGASPQDGFNFEQFAALHTAHAKREAARRRLQATKALTDAYKVGAISKEQLGLSIERMREEGLASN